jgi:hypothetical protein
MTIQNQHSDDYAAFVCEVEARAWASGFAPDGARVTLHQPKGGVRIRPAYRRLLMVSFRQFRSGDWLECRFYRKADGGIAGFQVVVEDWLAKHFVSDLTEGGYA